jgi:hypothetical protein
MQISPPFGYQEIVPFLKTHKVRLPAPGELPEFVRRSNAMPISHTEFELVARDYPIVFTSGDAGKTFAPVAVLGISAAENLYVSQNGWASGVYLPAYARRHPFCMARVSVDNVEQQQRLICVEMQFLDEGGQAMFEDGQPVARWAEIERLLSEYEADLERAREMCALLADYGLLEPFTVQATLAKAKGGGAMHVTGMHKVSDKSLESLNSAQVKNLMRQGAMARVYMHMMSLGNFSRLLERKAARLEARPVTDS